jgi:hypothetical protein
MTELTKLIAAAIRPLGGLIGLQRTWPAPDDDVVVLMTPLAPARPAATRQLATRPAGFPEVAEGAD